MYPCTTNAYLQDNGYHAVFIFAKYVTEIHYMALRALGSFFYYYYRGHAPLHLFVTL